jgi:hypothetical protein
LIYNRQVTVAAGAVIEVFDEIGISPERSDVAIQVLGGTSVYLVEDGAGTNPGPKLSWATSPSAPWRGLGLETSGAAWKDAAGRCSASASKT